MASLPYQLWVIICNYSLEQLLANLITDKWDIRFNDVMIAYIVLVLEGDAIISRSVQEYAFIICVVMIEPN